MTTKTKLIEIRDEGTTMPALAIKFDPQSDAERWLLARSGYGHTTTEQRKYVLLATIAGSYPQINCDAYDWKGGRTARQAHLWLEHHFDEITSGDVLDIEFINNETSKPKQSERLTSPEYSL